jgi:hypothetical protein
LLRHLISGHLHQTEDNFVPAHATSKSTSSLLRLFTAYGTPVYVDRSGRLRHWPLSDDPLNAGLVLQGGCGQIVCDLLGSVEPVVCFSDRSQTVASANAQGESFTSTIFEILQVEDQQVALMVGEFFLCAEPDGRLTLSRTQCSNWEKFRLDSCATDPGQDTRPAPPMQPRKSA